MLADITYQITVVLVNDIPTYPSQVIMLTKCLKGLVKKYIPIICYSVYTFVKMLKSYECYLYVFGGWKDGKYVQFFFYFRN